MKVVFSDFSSYLTFSHNRYKKTRSNKFTQSPEMHQYRQQFPRQHKHTGLHRKYWTAHTEI